MTKGDKMIIATAVATPFVLILLAVSYEIFKCDQMENNMKSVLAQSRVADMNTLSSYGVPDPSRRLIYGINEYYFKFNSCCSEQQFPKASRSFYKAGSKMDGGTTYSEWAGKPFPNSLVQGSFGSAQIKVQGKLYDLDVVNDTKAKKTTIIIGHDDNSE